MRKIAIYNHKGGVGKTTTAVNMAYNLTIVGKRVLLVDADPQGNATSFYRRYNMNKVSLIDALEGKCSFSRVIKRTNYEHLDIAPTNFWLKTAEPVHSLKELLNEVQDKYDYCIIDCPPAPNGMTEQIMDAADKVIVTIKPSQFSKEGFGNVLDIIAEGHPDMEVECLFTMFYRNKCALQIIRDILKTYDCRFYDNIIRRSVSAEYAEAKKKPLLKCASRSTVALDYVDFVSEFLEKEDGHGNA